MWNHSTCFQFPRLVFLNNPIELDCTQYGFHLTCLIASYPSCYRHVKGDTDLDGWELPSGVCGSCGHSVPLLLPDDRFSRLCSDLHAALRCYRVNGVCAEPDRRIRTVSNRAPSALPNELSGRADRRSTKLVPLFLLNSSVLVAKNLSQDHVQLWRHLPWP